MRKRFLNLTDFITRTQDF